MVTRHGHTPCNTDFDCQDRGLLLMAPEWRLSMHLKVHELWEGSRQAKEGTKALPETMHALEEVLQLPSVDILDESDELMHHRWGPV